MASSAILSDVRFALRQIARSPLFFGTLLGTLVVGIGSTTAMFSLLQGLLWRPLPYPEPERLVMSWAVRGTDDRLAVSIQDYRDIQQRTQSVEHSSAAHSWLYSLSASNDVAEGVVGVQVTGSFFEMLGSRPLLGRFLEPADDRAGAPPVAVIGAAVWRRRFGSDPGLVGREVWLDGKAFTVVGIAPESFGFSFPPMVGMRARSLEARVALTVDGSRRLSVLLGSFACVALALATFGLYALVAYSLSLRTRELGIRSALGAPPAAVVWRVLRSGLVWLGLGSVLGVGGAFLIGNLVAETIPGARGFDLRIYGLVALALGTACVLASFVPAMRAARISPASALRQL